MNTNTLAAAVIGFLLGGLLVSTAAALEDDNPTPSNHGTSLSQVSHQRQSPTGQDDAFVSTPV